MICFSVLANAGDHEIMMTMNKGSCNKGLYCSVLETEARRMERLDFDDGVSLQSLKKLKSFEINTVFAKIFSVENSKFFFGTISGPLLS